MNFEKVEPDENYDVVRYRSQHYEFGILRQMFGVYRVRGAKISGTRPSLPGTCDLDLAVSGLTNAVSLLDGVMRTFKFANENMDLSMLTKTQTLLYRALTEYSPERPEDEDRLRYLLQVLDQTDKLIEFDVLVFRLSDKLQNSNENQNPQPTT